MRSNRNRALCSLTVGVSLIALSSPQIAYAQAAPEPAPSGDTTAANPPPQQDIVITGIRGSLKRSMDIKRNAQGVVDAISAEEIGKFPDTNLAESLQRITGVSIDR